MRRFIGAGSTERSCSCAARRGHQPGGRKLGHETSVRRRSSSTTSSTTPTSCPGSCWRPGGAPARDPGGRLRAGDPGGVPAPASAPDQDRRGHPGLQRLGTVVPVKAIVGSPAALSACARWLTVPSRSATCGWTCARSTPTSSSSAATRSWPTGHRRVVYGKRDVLEDMPPLAGRRQHDRRRHLPSAPCTTARRDPFRGRHRQHRRCGGPGGPWSMSSASASRTSARTNTRCSTMPPPPEMRPIPACAWSVRREPKASVLSSC